MANYVRNDGPSDQCCRWTTPLNECSRVVIYRENERRPCAEPPDWCNHPELKKVQPYNRKQYREQRLTQWLETQVPRNSGENFCNYVRRCYSAAELQLRQSKKMQIGDEYADSLDKYVFRLFFGARSRQKIQGVSWGIHMEELVLQLLREECAELVRDGYLKLDPRLCRSPSSSPWPG